MPADFVLVAGLIARFLPTPAGEGGPFFRGALFGPVMWFLLAVLGAFAFGAVLSTAGAYFRNAAWVECRAFLQLVGVYLLASNVITDRRRLGVLSGSLCSRSA